MFSQAVRLEAHRRANIVFSTPASTHVTMLDKAFAASITPSHCAYAVPAHFLQPCALMRCAYGAAAMTCCAIPHAAAVVAAAAVPTSLLCHALLQPCACTAACSCALHGWCSRATTYCWHATQAMRLCSSTSSAGGWHTIHSCTQFLNSHTPCACAAV